VIATANITKKIVSGSIAVSAAAAMMLGETSEAMKIEHRRHLAHASGSAQRSRPAGTGKAQQQGHQRSR
jgi:hypothetical protein